MGEELADWTVNFVKHKDILTRSIVDIKKESDKVVVKYKDREKIFLIVPNLESVDSFGDDEIGVVCLNTNKNIDFLLKNWKTLSKYQKLSMYFVNPKKQGMNKWVLFPHTHNRIADDDSLKTGFKSMAEEVGLV